MTAVKHWIKDLAGAAGLYDPLHRLWYERPSVREVGWNFGYRLAGAPDRQPVPPTRLIYSVANSREVAWFLYGGRIGKRTITYVLQHNGYCLDDFQAILDFGCGCGRVMRWWKGVSGPKFYGTDYNPDPVRWCQQHLGSLAEFSQNGATPPLAYPNERFDLVYAISIFTHFTEELQRVWLAELRRILRPGGLLLITLHGESRFGQLSPEEQERFRSGRLVVRQPEEVGTNQCGAYHPKAYAYQQFGRDFEVVDYIEGGATDTDQDVYLLRKPLQGSLT